jgi:hypothetical protein
MKIYLSTFILFLLPQVLFAQSSGLQLLEIAPTATELSRAEASLATPNGSSSLYTNPALLTLAQSSTINIGYTNWIGDSNNIFGGINLKNGRRAIAFSVYTSGINGFEQRNAPGESNGDFSIQYVSLSGAYAYDFNLFSAGATFHYLNEEVYPFRATGYAFSFGIARAFLQDRIRFGASLLNRGNMEELDQKATELPSSFNLGVAVDVFEFTHQKSPDLPIKTTLMADFVVPMSEESSAFTDFNPTDNYLNLGVSLLVADVVEINAGYKTQDNVRPTSFGIGFLTERVTFNYALIPFNTGFGTVHSIGLQYQL